jgi:hypothetical protein
MSQRWLAEVVSSSDLAIYELRMLLAIVRSQEMSGYWQRVEIGLLNIVWSSDKDSFELRLDICMYEVAQM